MNIAQQAAQAWRDFVVDGSPASGVHQPAKSDIRDLFAEIQRRVSLPPTGPYARGSGYGNIAPAGDVHRFAERVLIGDAVDFNIDWYGPAWSNRFGLPQLAFDLHSWAFRDSTLIVDSPLGGKAIMGHAMLSKSAAWPGAGSGFAAGIGVGGYAVVDMNGVGGWGLYADAKKTRDAFCVGLEAAIGNVASEAIQTPFNVKGGGSLGGTAIWSASGAGMDSANLPDELLGVEPVQPTHGGGTLLINDSAPIILAANADASSIVAAIAAAAVPGVVASVVDGKVRIRGVPQIAGAAAWLLQAEIPPLHGGGAFTVNGVSVSVGGNATAAQVAAAVNAAGIVGVKASASAVRVTLNARPTLRGSSWQALQAIRQPVHAASHMTMLSSWADDSVRAWSGIVFARGALLDRTFTLDGPNRIYEAFASPDRHAWNVYRPNGEISHAFYVDPTPDGQASVALRGVAGGWRIDGPQGLAANVLYVGGGATQAFLSRGSAASDFTALREPSSGIAFQIGANTVAFCDAAGFNLPAAYPLRVAGDAVVGAAAAGWSLPTGTLSRAALNPATATAAQIAQTLNALISDIHAAGGKHGLLKA
jgi:hypothetical protein